MYVIDRIFSYVWDLSDWFYDAYQTVNGWVWPFYLLGGPLYSLYRTTYYIVSRIAQFGDLADYWASKIGDILSLSQIISYFQPWINYATDAWSWVRYSFFNVWDIVDDWWANMRATVIGWINFATEGLDALRVAWDEFWTTSFPYLVSFKWLGTWWNTRIKDIQAMLNSAFLERAPFWAGWQDIRDKVVEFFDNPVEFVWGLFADWFLGPEE